MFIANDINYKWITVHEATLYNSVFSILVWNCLITVLLGYTFQTITAWFANHCMYLIYVIQVESSRNCFPDWVLLSDEICGKGLEHSSVGDQHTLRVASSSEDSTASNTQKAGDILHSGWSPKAFWWDDGGPRTDRCSNTSSEIQNHLDTEAWYHWNRCDIIL